MGIQRASHSPTGIGIDTTLAASSRELGELAHLSKEIQWAISTLLERAHHPDLVAEMHVLQDIDRLQQTLVDLSALLNMISELNCDEALDQQSVKAIVRLDSLRHRLFHEDISNSSSDASDEVTWF